MRTSLLLLLALTFVAAPATGAAKKKPKPKVVAKPTIEEQEKTLGAGDEKSTLLRVLVAPDDPQLGPDDAPVTIVHFVDFGGVEDRAQAALLYALRSDYEKDVRVVFKHLPTRGNSRTAHEAALAAGEQGKFWEMHAILIANPDKYDKDAIERYAEALQLDMKTFRASLASKQLGPRIDAELAYARKIGITRAPGLFVNGVELPAAVKDADLRQRVDDGIVAVAAMRKKNKKLKAGAVYAEIMKTARPTRATGGAVRRANGPDPNKVYQVPVAGAPMKGDPGAKLTIIIFAEFKCPYCQRVQATLADVEKKYPNEVRIVYRHFIVHQQARDLQRAAAAAAEQGKFWDMHDLLYVDISKNDGSKIDDYAAKIGLDATLFRDALDTKRADAVVDGDALIGRQFGVSGTPAFFVNGRFLSGAQPLANFVKLCDVELARADALLAKGATRANLYDELIRGGELKAP